MTMENRDSKPGGSPPPLSSEEVYLASSSVTSSYPSSPGSRASVLLRRISPMCCVVRLNTSPACAICAMWQKYLLLRKNILPHLTVVGGVVGGDEHGGRAHAVGAAAVEHRRHHQSRHTADSALISLVTILTMHRTVYQLTSAAVLPCDCDWTCKSSAFDHLLQYSPAAALVPGKYVRLLLTARTEHCLTDCGPPTTGQSWMKSNQLSCQRASAKFHSAQRRLLTLSYSPCWNRLLVLSQSNKPLFLAGV